VGEAEVTPQAGVAQQRLEPDARNVPYLKALANGGIPANAKDGARVEAWITRVLQSNRHAGLMDPVALESTVRSGLASHSDNTTEQIGFRIFVGVDARKALRAVGTAVRHALDKGDRRRAAGPTSRSDGRSC
jgi:hypothetical protein